MPPRRPAYLRNAPLTFASTAESIESRVKRLRPSNICNGSTPNAEARVGTQSGVASSSAGVQALATEGLRGDVPVVRGVKRGSFSEAAAAAAAALALRGAEPILEDLLTDRNARSSVAAKASWVNTWRRFHGLAFANASPPVPLLPMTPMSLVHVAALFKAGGYRGFPNYLSAVKALHIEDGFEWGQLLSHTGAWVTRSVLRGIGPARQSCSFLFPELCLLPSPTDPLVPGGPHAPFHFAKLASIFLLREVEAANTLVSSWSFNHEAQELTWLLPASKSDHLALGTRRTWGCLCDVPGLCCPFHVALSHWTWFETAGFIKPGIDGPLFPATGGRAPSKAAVVATFEAIGSLLGQPLLGVSGIRLFGGHTARVTGAQALAALGVEINKIRILARHSGDTILRYVVDAPLKSLTADLFSLTSRTSVGSSSVSCTTAPVLARLRKLESAMVLVRTEVQTQAQDVVALATGFARTDTRVFVQNTTTATVHLAVSLDGGHAACGWRFATARRTSSGPAFRIISTLVNLPGTMLCERCMPTERAVALSVADSAVLDLSGDES